MSRPERWTAIAWAVVAGCVMIAGARAEEKPLWELGIGAAPINFPAYRGSEDRQTFVLPVPYVVYRGDVFKVDRRGVHGLLFDTDRVKFSLSANGSAPVDSDQSSARDGMSDLDSTLEIGPSLRVLLAKDEAHRKIQFKLPVRAVIATDFSNYRFAGFTTHPHLDFSMPGVLGGWKLGLIVGPLFGTRKNHEYFYDVKRRFETPSRPEFDADGGYSGSALIMGTSRRFRRFWVGAFVRYDNLSGAAFESSPLVETNHAFSGGFAAAWVFAESKEMVTVEP